MLERNEGRSMPAMLAAGGLLAVLCLAAGYVWYARSVTRGPTDDAAAPVVAPTETEYDAAAAEAAGPFLEQALDFEVGVGDASAMARLAVSVKERILGLRLPAARQSAHLELVLLLDQWERAAADPALVEAAVGRTTELTAKYPWLLR